MTDKRYNLIFEGNVEAGHDPSQTRIILENLFEFDSESRADLFSGQQVVLAKGMNAATANSFKQALAAAGAKTHLLPINNMTEAERRSAERRITISRRSRMRNNAVLPDRRQGADRRD